MVSGIFCNYWIVNGLLCNVMQSLLGQGGAKSVKDERCKESSLEGGGLQSPVLVGARRPPKVKGCEDSHHGWRGDEVVYTIF